MTAQLTKKEAIAYIKTLEGKGSDFDGAFGWQCFDLVNMYWYKLFGHGLKGEGAADIPNENNFKGEATVYNNTESFKAQEGDIGVLLNTHTCGRFRRPKVMVRLWRTLEKKKEFILDFKS